MPSILRATYCLTLSALLIMSGCATDATPSESDLALKPTAELERAKVMEEAKDLGVSPLALEPVYFQTESATLGAKARHQLKLHMQSIIDHPEWGVLRIEGHCDERGSDSFNIELGSRRAVAIERFLVEAGVPGSRLQIRTFGEARPVAAGHHESAWAQNRRSEFTFDTLLSSTGN
jgi:peptidoglycan-associated lipoprotein